MLLRPLTRTSKSHFHFRLRSNPKSAPIHQSHKMAKDDPHSLSKGDDVTWSWGSQHPKGTVKDVKDDGAEVKTKKGSTISKDGSKEDPAVVIETQNGNNAVKNVSTSPNTIERFMDVERSLLMKASLVLGWVCEG